MLITEIEQLRNKIDFIDKEIVALLEKRRDCAVEIGRLKDKLREVSSLEKIGAYDPTREEEVIGNIKKHWLDGSSDGVEFVFKEIISLCRNAAHLATVVFIDDLKGIESVGMEILGHSCRYCSCTNESDFFNKLFENEFNIGLLPNSKMTKPIIEKLNSMGFKVSPTNKSIGSNEISLIFHC